MVQDLINVLMPLGISFVIGLVAGYALRKIIKIALVIAGGIFLIFVVGMGWGWVQPDYDKVYADTTTFVNNTQVVPQMNTFISNIGPLFIVGLLPGLVIGFVKAG